MQTAHHTIRKWIFGAARLPAQSDNQPAKHNTFSNVLVRRLTHTMASSKRWGLRLGSGMLGLPSLVHIIFHRNHMVQ